MTQQDLIKEAVEILHTQAALAQAVGVSPVQLNQWYLGERPVPIKYGASIEIATKGVVSRKRLFPDDWQAVFPELKGS
jgi:DNA-binding transcriptional regulator YdaS (Cro superfamily)